MKKCDPIPNPPISATSISWPWNHPQSNRGVSSIGEDGEDWIIEGHVDPEVAFELLRQCAAALYDESCAEDMFGDSGCHEVADVKAGYGVFTEHAGWCDLVLGEYEEEDFDKPTCTCGEYGWFVTWGKVTAETPGAVPLMVLEA